MKERLESLTGTYQYINFCLYVLDLRCLELATVLYFVVLLGMEKLNCHEVIPAARQWLILEVRGLYSTLILRLIQAAKSY